MSELREITIAPRHDVKYHEYVCLGCGEVARNTYCEPYRTNLLDRRMCYMCNHWFEFEKDLKSNHAKKTIIGGHVYGPGNRTSGPMRGMAGRRFDIEYIEPSVYQGQRVTTFDLWSGSALPEKLRVRYPDTAKFLGGAEKANAGEITCFNSSDASAEPYPLPMSLRALK